jgi:hypothetical protein
MRVASSVLHRFTQWWIETHDRRQEEELAFALAAVAAAIITATLKILIEAL